MSKTIIILKIKDNDIEQCKIFANKVVDQTYNRFKKDLIERKKRIFYGKIGEVIFYNYLISLGKKLDNSEMFKVFQGEQNVDSFDFKTLEGKTIDIKTAYQSFHNRIIIPEDQYENNNPKDFYVGVKVFFKEKIAKIYGFTSGKNLLLNTKQNFGEGNAYWEYLDTLSNIKNLVSQM